MHTTQSDLFGADSVISEYSRAQAIEDGVLADVTPVAKRAGFRVPVALTCGALAALTPAGEDSLEESLDFRLWNVLSVCRATASASNDNLVFFSVPVVRDRRVERVELRAAIGPGDGPEPVITIMLPNED